ncbi:unnamed protein product [Adineta steineri]|uniref:Uncharacterized protein n=1 Tax=Adineta steineri TaxID=433720 RepID=A0A815CUZ3_9BILA|nr:unnamed protein product [Adineta steineri]
MVESNAGHNLRQDLVEKHRNVIGQQHPIIIVNSNKDQNKIFEQSFSEYSRITNRPLYVFDNVDECCDFVYEQASSNEEAKCIVLVQDQFANELIPSIVHAEQIEDIIILNENPPSQQERESMREYTKAGSERNSSITSVPVLFTITIQKQDVSSDSPFADISQYSTIRDEKEILFTPGQMFMIDKFDMTYENGTFIYLINMNFYNNTKFNLNAQYSRMKSQWQEETNDSLLHLAQLLTASNRYDQAKELYERLLTQKSDQQTKMICYKGLREIASFMNSSDEVKAYTQKMMESKFDSHQTLSPMPDEIVVGRGFQQMLSTFMNNAQEALSQTSLDRPLQDIASYTKTNEWNDLTYQAPQIAFTTGQTLMHTQQYQLAILFLEVSVAAMNGINDAEFVLSHKSKCYKAIADCYCQLGDNREALKNYTLALNENIHLRPDEHIKILVCTGKILEATNQSEVALSKYIKAAEICQNELPNANSNDIVEIEECIKRVTSRLCPPDT